MFQSIGIHNVLLTPTQTLFHFKNSQKIGVLPNADINLSYHFRNSKSTNTSIAHNLKVKFHVCRFFFKKKIKQDMPTPQLGKNRNLKN